MLHTVPENQNNSAKLTTWVRKNGAAEVKTKLQVQWLKWNLKFWFISFGVGPSKGHLSGLKTSASSQCFGQRWRFQTEMKMSSPLEQRKGSNICSDFRVVTIDLMLELEFL
jgi:hypothetical protein